jgi:hypothetical protein
MRIEFVSRGIICLTGMPPTALDLVAFEQATDLQRPGTQVIQQTVAAADYGSLRVIVSLGQPSNQLQLETAGPQQSNLYRAAADELIRQASLYGIRGLGFNGFGRLVCDPGEDPMRELVNEQVINARLGADITRAGAKLLYPLDDAVATLDLSPIPEDNTMWAVSINRHYDRLPGDEERARALDWFAALNVELVPLVEGLVRDGAAHEAEHAA